MLFYILIYLSLSLSIFQSPLPSTLESSLPIGDTKIISTHDSTHIHPIYWIPQFFNGYTKKSNLTIQLDTGIRGLEIDITRPIRSNISSISKDEYILYDYIKDIYCDLHDYNCINDYVVENFPVIDNLSTCCTLFTCLTEVIKWSIINKRHYPIFILIDPDISFNFAAVIGPYDFLHLSKLIHDFSSNYKDIIYKLSDYADENPFIKTATTVETCPRFSSKSVSSMRGKIIIQMDQGENYFLQMIEAKYVDPFKLSYWPFCSFEELINAAARNHYMFQHCHFIKFFAYSEHYIEDIKKSHQQGYLMRVFTDYRIIQIPNFEIDGEYVNDLIKNSKMSLTSWYAQSFYEILDTNRDGFINNDDTEITELINLIAPNYNSLLWLIFNTIGIPSTTFVWFLLTTIESIKKELFFTTDINEVKLIGNKLLSTCAQHLSTDFPSALFGNFNYSFPMPTFEYEISICADKLFLTYYKPMTLRNESKYWISSSELKSFSIKPQISSPVSYMLYIKSLFYVTFFLILICFILYFYLKILLILYCKIISFKWTGFNILKWKRSSNQVIPIVEINDIGYLITADHCKDHNM